MFFTNVGNAVLSAEVRRKEPDNSGCINMNNEDTTNNENVADCFEIATFSLFL